MKGFKVIFENFAVKANALVYSYLRKASAKVESDATKIYPFRKNIITGKLISSIYGKVSPLDTGFQLSLSARALSKKKYDYAPIQEFGSKKRNIKAGKFLQDAWFPFLENEIENDIEKELIRAWN